MPHIPDFLLEFLDMDVSINQLALREGGLGGVATLFEKKAWQLVTFYSIISLACTSWLQLLGVPLSNIASDY